METLEIPVKFEGTDASKETKVKNYRVESEKLKICFA